jgi:hypothetical protein
MLAGYVSIHFLDSSVTSRNITVTDSHELDTVALNSESVQMEAALEVVSIGSCHKNQHFALVSYLLVFIWLFTKLILL